MTVKTYESIGELISHIKRYKRVIEQNKKWIDNDFKKLNKLLKENGQQEIKLEDIKSKPEDDEDLEPIF